MRAIAVAGEASVEEAVAAVQRAAVDGRPRARGRRLDPRAVRLLRRGHARGSRSSTTAASARSCDRLAWAGAAVTVFPHDADPDELARFDGVLLSNGPGDPEPLDDEVETVRELLGRVPVLGICLGHQLLALATGHETFKLPFGHRGANHPVLDQRADRVLVTSQNHGFAVAPSGRDARRRTSRSTTAPSRASTSRSCARARCSSIPRRGPARTTPGRCSSSWVEEVSLAEAA